VPSSETIASSSTSIVAPPLHAWSSESFLPVVWFAPFLSGGGYCSEAHSFISSLASFLGPSKLAVVQHGDSVNTKFIASMDDATHTRMRQHFKHEYQLFQQPWIGGRGSVAICHSEPGAWHPAHYSTSQCPHDGATIRIGRTMFETDRLPNAWAERLNQMDYVWVPTQFHVDIFSAGGVDPDKLVVMPESVDTEFFSPEHAATLPPFRFPGEDDDTSRTLNTSAAANDGSIDPASRSILPHRPFRFLSIFKWEERKGWRILLEAFIREFTQWKLRRNDEDEDNNKNQDGNVAPSAQHHPPVILYILTSAYHSDADFQRRIDEFVAALNLQPHHESDWQASDDKHHATNNYADATPILPSIRLLPSGLSQVDLVRLYGSVDCFVLPSRGEGWGRPHVESMSMRLPLIATKWSGPQQYMNEENSFPLMHDALVDIESGAFKGHRWAQPSIRHLRQLMRQVINQPGEAKRRAGQARRDMVERYCLDCVARQVVAELARILHFQPQHSPNIDSATAHTSHDLGAPTTTRASQMPSTHSMIEKDEL